MTTHVKIPEYLDPGSIGGWVREVQETMYRAKEAHVLPGKVPQQTGVHVGHWVDYIRGLQLIWNIDNDGGMGPQFRKTYATELEGKFPLFHEMDAPQAPTLVVSPESTKWILPTERMGSESESINFETISGLKYHARTGGNGYELESHSLDRLMGFVHRKETRDTMFLVMAHDRQQHYLLSTHSAVRSMVDHKSRDRVVMPAQNNKVGQAQLQQLADSLTVPLAVVWA